MKPKTLLVLAGMALALGAFVWFFERDLPSSDERRSLEKRVFSDLEPEQVNAVILEHEGQRVRLDRTENEASRTPGAGAEKAQDAMTEDDAEGGESEPPEEDPFAAQRWRLTQPVVARADDAQVDRLLDDLKALEKIRTLAEVVEADVGLDAPRARVTLVEGEREKVLRIGAAIPASRSMVVGFEGSDEAYVVPTSLFDEVNVPVDRWRDATLFHAASDRVERLVLARGDQEVVLARSDRGFELESPVHDRADKEKVSSLLTQLGGLKAQAFRAADEGTKISEGPFASLEATVRGHEEPFVLDLGPPAALPGSRLARAEGQVFDLHTEELEKVLARSPEEWRARGWSVYTMPEVAALTVEEDGQRFELRRQGSDWLRDGESMPYLEASDLLLSVSLMRAEEVLSEETARDRGLGAGPARLTVTVRGDDGGEEVLELSDGDGKPPVGRSSLRLGIVLRLPESSVKELRDHVVGVREAAVEVTEPPGAEEPASEVSVEEESGS